MIHKESEARCAARVDIDAASKRGRDSCSINKASTLCVPQLCCNVTIRACEDDHPSTEISRTRVDSTTTKSAWHMLSASNLGFFCRDCTE